jgi:hypothetical protein
VSDPIELTDFEADAILDMVKEHAAAEASKKPGGAR